MERREPTQKALVLAGGGARGSYQVGVWRALMELDWHPQIITGTSVGGLNGAMFVLDLYETARDMWLTIRSRDVMELPEENADLFLLLHSATYSLYLPMHTLPNKQRNQSLTAWTFQYPVIQ